MKVRSVKTLVSLFSVTALALTANAFAHHHHKSSGLHHRHPRSHHSSHKEGLCPGKSIIRDLTEKAGEGLHIFFIAGQNTLTSWGATEDPDPETNAFLASIIELNTQAAETGTNLIIDSLRSLGVSENYLSTIHRQFDAYYAGLIAYAECFNEENIPVIVPPAAILISCQQQTYDAFMAAATALGETLADISEYPELVIAIQNQAFAQANAVQAARGFLVSPIANPDDPASEAAALTVLGFEVQIAAEEIADVLIKRVAHEQCEKILKL